MQSLLKRHKTPMLKTLSEATRSTVMSHCTVLLMIDPPPPPPPGSEHRFTCAVYCFVVYSVVLQGTCLHGIVVLQGPVYASILLFCRAHIYMCILLFCKVHVYACILLFCSTCLRVAGQYLCILLFCGAFCFAGYNNLFSMFMCVFRCCRAHAYMCIYFSGHTFTHVFCCFAWHKFTHVFHCFAGHMFTCVVSRSEYTWTMP